MSNESNVLPARPKWFSIKEAAEYLDVGEPTLFRWMRDGKITYRKVGDSTRFFQEDLDAVMEVFHSQKDRDNVKKVCSLCHGTDLVEGVYRTTGLNYFQPKKTKFWTLKASNVDTLAYMCRTCGAISLFGNVKQLEELLQKPATAPVVEKEEKENKETAE
jgi:excisionase family DNA binding protein